MKIGDHVVKTWSRTQPTIATSSGEAELIAMQEGATRGMGMQTIMEEIGLAPRLEMIRVYTDSAAAKSFVATGLRQDATCRGQAALDAGGGETWETLGGEGAGDGERGRQLDEVPQRREVGGVVGPPRRRDAGGARASLRAGREAWPGEGAGVHAINFSARAF